VIIEDVLVGHGGVDQIAAGGVQNAFGLAGGTGGVEDEERVLGVHLFRWAVGRGFRHELAPLEIPSGRPGDLTTRMLHHDNLFDDGTLLDRFVGIGLQRDGFASAQPFISGDHHPALAVLDASRQGIRRKTAEDDGVDDADAGAGQHGYRQFRDHGKIDGGPVTFPKPQRLQNIGKLADFFMQLPVSDEFADGRIVRFPDEGDLIAAFFQMAVQAVVAHIQFAVGKPLDLNIALKRAFFHLRPGFEPIQTLGMLTPEAFGILDRLFIHLQILVVVHPGCFSPGVRNGKQLI